jgi:hypothetical protein
LAQPSEEDKLLKIREEMKVPVKLSELEREKFNNIFETLKEWLDDSRTSTVEKDRDEAYRYVDLLIGHLQMVDVDYIAGASRATPIVTPSVLENVEPLEEPAHNIKSPPHVRPTAEQVDGWLGDMNPQIRSKVTRLLDCFKQYLDPDGEAGIDVICNRCRPEEIAKCLIIADPSIEDASTVFMKHQLGV